MQYDGVGAAGTNQYVRGNAMVMVLGNSGTDDAKYVGWMFGGTNGSSSKSREEAQRNETDLHLKTVVDNWFITHIVNTGYSDYIANSIFCNDRSIPGKSVTKWTQDTELGYGRNYTGYGALGRFMTGNNGTSLSANINPKPQFTCPQENDKFTVDKKSGGNGALSYPVGLITADEPVYI